MKSKGKKLQVCDRCARRFYPIIKTDTLCQHCLNALGDTRMFDYVGGGVMKKKHMPI